MNRNRRVKTQSLVLDSHNNEAIHDRWLSGLESLPASSSHSGKSCVKGTQPQDLDSLFLVWREAEKGEDMLLEVNIS